MINKRDRWYNPPISLYLVIIRLNAENEIEVYRKVLALHLVDKKENNN
jgi:hypothetical protein